MSNERGPWAHMTPEPERPAPQRPRLPRARIAWPVVLLLAGVGGLVLALVKAFPDTMRSGAEWGDAAYLAGFLLLVATGLWRSRRLSPLQLVRHAGGWVAIAAVLALGFAYRDLIAAAPQRLALAFNTDRPVATGPHELVISEDDQGGFEVVAKVNGQPVRFTIDTGATDTVLSPADARRLGIDLTSLKFDVPAETANGRAFGAPYAARELQVGPIRLADFHMVVNQAPMSRSLLGLSFLNRLDSFEIRGRKLYLTWGEGPNA